MIFIVLNLEGEEIDRGSLEEITSRNPEINKSIDHSHCQLSVRGAYKGKYFIIREDDKYEIIPNYHRRVGIKLIPVCV